MYEIIFSGFDVKRVSLAGSPALRVFLTGTGLAAARRRQTDDRVGSESESDGSVAAPRPSATVQPATGSVSLPA